MWSSGAEGALTPVVQALDFTRDLEGRVLRCLGAQVGETCDGQGWLAENLAELAGGAVGDGCEIGYRLGSRLPFRGW